jgi:hypothetical protein
MIMILNVSIAGNIMAIEVPQELINNASELFVKMDVDMDKGWTMGREYIDNPNIEQRCQIVADKLLTAIDNDDAQLKTMMAAYILARIPNVITLHIDNTGEINESWLDCAKES